MVVTTKYKILKSKMWKAMLNFIIYSTFTILPLVMVRYIKSNNNKKNIKSKKSDDFDEFYDFILITHKNRNCEQHVAQKSICGHHCSALQLKKIVNYFGHAKNSISVCMYVLTLRDITFELINCHKRGIKVRIITDNEMIPCSSTCLNKMKQYGKKTMKSILFNIIDFFFFKVSE